MTTLAHRGPLSRQLALGELPGGEKRVPLRALVLSLAAMAVATWGAFTGPEILGGYDALSWLLVVIPSFLLSYYRGWRGAVRAQAAATLLVLLLELVAENFLRIEVNWLLLFLIAATILSVGLGLGVLSELLQRERAAALVLAYSDPLTGLPNRRLLDFILEKEFAFAQRGRFLTLVLLDLDGFKAYNETYGHRVGDEALQNIAATLDGNTRRSNVSGRHGGDEFLSILSGEKAAGSRVFAERTRKAIADLTLSTGVKVTVSTGLATYDPSMRTPAELLDAADRALHRAKALGGNRSVVLEPVGETTTPPSDHPEGKQAWTRRALEEAETRYRSLFTEVPLALYRTSPEGRILDANRALGRLLGCPDRESLLGMNASELYVDPRERERWRTQMERSGAVRNFEAHIRRRDGAHIWVRHNDRAVFDAEGEVLYYEGSLEDVTERKRAEHELSEANDQIVSILDSISDAFFAVDREWRLTFLNAKAQAYLERLGKSRDSVIGKRLWDKFPTPADSEGYQAAQSAMEDRVPTTFERFYPPLDVWFEIHAYPSKDGLSVYVRDITERKRAEEALQRSEEQLRLSQRLEAVGRLAGGVAHDFNNLLTAILGHTGLLLGELNQGDRMRSELEEIKKAGERAATLTRQLLAFSRKQVLRPKVLDLNAVVVDMDKMLRRLIGEDVELGTALEPALGQVKADPGQLEQVIVNLVVNARDAMPEGGKLTLETANVELGETYARRRSVVRLGSYVMLAVSDTGVGMDGETEAKIFEPFFTTKEVGKGTGLGLSTVYGIVKQSEGYVWVYSEPGHGTTFKIYLPRVDAPVESAREGTQPGSGPLRGSETVLLVEDESVVRTLVRDVLQKNGYTVLEAKDADEALRIGETHEGTIHLVLTDTVMPGMRGRELAERLGSFYPEAKVLYMSGYTDQAVVHLGYLDSNADFLQKPFTPDLLARRVREILDRAPEAGTTPRNP